MGDYLNKQKRLGIKPSPSLPILENMRENGISTDCLHSKSPGEMSRIIVCPNSRGLGVSRLLSEAVASQARSIGCDAILVECLPYHELLFEKLGYAKLFESLKYKHLSVPERVVVMRYPIAS
jgi:GNAT superfamily N-acetyltransferase